MSLFPDMPIPPVPELDPNGFAPALTGATSGVLPGLDTSLRSSLRNYRPGDMGIDELSGQLQLTLPISNWEWFHFHAKGTTAEINASTAGNITVYTVPDDRRAWLDGLTFQRITGGDDNNMDRVLLEFPVGYYDGDEHELQLKRITATSYLIWPDPSGLQTPTYLLPAPILLEPGTRIIVRWNGDGVAATATQYEIAMRQTKLVRQAVP